MSDRQFELAVADWLEGGSDRTPPAAIQAVLLAVKSTPQRRDPCIPRRFIQMRSFLRYGATAALVLAVGLAAALILSNRTTGPAAIPGSLTASGPSARPSTSSAATAVPGTADWSTYASARYGFSIKYPPTWSVTASTRDWATPVDRLDWQTPASEHFLAPGSSLLVTAWAEPIPGQVSLDEWLAKYCSEPACDAPLAAAVDIDMLGTRGKLVTFEKDVEAFARIGPSVYVVAAWKPTAQSTVEQFISTMRLTGP